MVAYKLASDLPMCFKYDLLGIKQLVKKMLMFVKFEYFLIYIFSGFLLRLI